MSVLILEGVTGAGKTSTIKAMQAIAALDLVDEEATFDDFMRDFAVDPKAAASRAHDRMARILDQIEAADGSHPYLLERFHFSQLALGSDWEWYRDIDDRCAALKCRVAVLTIPENELASRALFRAEYSGTDWQNLVPRFGTEEEALNAIRRAQSARIERIKESRLQYWTIDTSGAAWGSYAIEIARTMGWFTTNSQ